MINWEKVRDYHLKSVAMYLDNLQKAEKADDTIGIIVNTICMNMHAGSAAAIQAGMN